MQGFVNRVKLFFEQNLFVIQLSLMMLVMIFGADYLASSGVLFDDYLDGMFFWCSCLIGLLGLSVFSTYMFKNK